MSRRPPQSDGTAPAPATPASLQAACQLTESGYSCLWFHRQRKNPIGEAWTTRSTQTVAQLTASYQAGYNLGVRCGHWSQPAPGMGLVVVDIDVKAPDADPEPYEYLGQLYQGPVHAVRTGSGGQHWWFAYPLDQLPPKANTRLAEGAHKGEATGRATPEWLIEVLSTGRALVCPPSLHPNGQRYRWISRLPALPLLPPAILRALPVEQVPPEPPREAPCTSTGSHSLAEQFNETVSWADILEPHGWRFVRQRGERGHWCRPGKDPRAGISATTRADLLYVFSSNTGFEPHRGYTKFDVYALLEYDGNRHHAAQALAQTRRAT
jgi:hypothetical protein